MAENLMSTSDHQERRTCERIELNRSVLLKLAGGQTINGITTDISLGGVKISTQDTYNEQWNEQHAILHIKLIDDELSPEYPCTIVRCQSGILCLKLDKKKAASFGAMVTRGVFKRKKSLT